MKTLGEKCGSEDNSVKMGSHPEGDRPENSVPNGDILLIESVLQVVVVGVGVCSAMIFAC